MLRLSSIDGVDLYVKFMRSYFVHVSCIHTPVGSVVLPSAALVCFRKSLAEVNQLAEAGHVTAIIMVCVCLGGGLGVGGGGGGVGGTSQERVLLRRK